MARELLDVSRVDAVALAANTVTEKIAAQLYAAKTPRNDSINLKKFAASSSQSFRESAGN